MQNTEYPVILRKGDLLAVGFTWRLKQFGWQYLPGCKVRLPHIPVYLVFGGFLQLAFLLLSVKFYFSPLTYLVEKVTPYIRNRWNKGDLVLFFLTPENSYIE